MVTVHANAPAQALDKMLAPARLGSAWPARELAKWLAAARPVVIQVALEGNGRRITTIGECLGFTERDGEVHFSVATLYDGAPRSGRQGLHYAAASDELLAPGGDDDTATFESAIVGVLRRLAHSHSAFLELLLARVTAHDEYVVTTELFCLVEPRVELFARAHDRHFV